MQSKVKNMLKVTKAKCNVFLYLTTLSYNSEITLPFFDHVFPQACFLAWLVRHRQNPFKTRWSYSICLRIPGLDYNAAYMGQTMFTMGLKLLKLHMLLSMLMNESLLNGTIQ